MSDSVREKFEKWLTTKTRFKPDFYPPHVANYSDISVMRMWDSYQAATAAADAEWRGVVEALEYVEANYDGMNKAAIVRQALAQAEQLMGRKKVYQCTVCGCELLDGRGKFLGDRQCNKHLPPV